MDIWKIQDKLKIIRQQVDDALEMVQELKEQMNKR